MEKQILPKSKVSVQEVVDKFFNEELTSRPYRPLTVKAIKYDIQEFVKQFPKLKYAGELDLEKVKIYQSYMNSKSLSDSSMHRKVISIKSFIKYLEIEGVIKNKFSDMIFIPRISEKEPRSLTKDQYTRFLEACTGSIRDLAIFTLLLQTGIRLSELTKLKIDDVDLPAKPSPDPLTGGGAIRIKHGKRNKTRELVLNYKACRVLKQYLRIRPESEYQELFLTKYKEPIHNRAVQKAFKKYATEAGIDWAHVHSLRTTNITMHLMKKTPINIIAQNAGHKSLATTNKYAAYVKSDAMKFMQGGAL